MNFGKVENPGEINFTLPPDNPDTKQFCLLKSTLKSWKSLLDVQNGIKKTSKIFIQKEPKMNWPITPVSLIV